MLSGECRVAWAREGVGTLEGGESMSFFDDFLKTGKTNTEPDLTMTFSIWSEKQPFFAKLPTTKSDRITISADQILLLMRESYKAGYNRAKL